MGRENAIWATGMMSGTSLDGVDWAEILTDGVDVFDFGASGYRPYSKPEEDVLRGALGLWPAGDTGTLPKALKIVENAHIKVLKGHTPNMI